MTGSALAMTAFSYMLSGILKKNFKEPQFINILIDRIRKKKDIVKREHVTGWLIHLSIGILFVQMFKICSFIFYMPLSVMTAVIFGIIAGINGACSWSLILRIHPHPPAINRLLFYSQLVVAHVIFGMVMVIILRNF
jgi:hypothetical protein